MGLLDNIEDPKTQALLSLGFGLLNSRGNFGQGLGQAGQQAMGTFADARKQQQQRAMQEQQMQSQALQQQMLQQQLAETQRVATEREQLSKLAAGSVISPQQGAMAANGGPTMAAAGAVGNTPQGFDWQRYSAGLAAINPMKALDVQSKLKKESPKLSKLEPMRTPDGKIVNIAVFEDGTTKVIPYGVRPDIALQNLGDRVVSIDKNELPGGQSFSLGASPDTRMQVGATMRGQDIGAETTRRGQNMTDQRQRESNETGRAAVGKVDWKQDTDGNWIALPKEIKSGERVTPTGTDAPGKRAVQAGHALDIISEARGLVDKGTSSYAGTAADQAARVVGISTGGSEVGAKLKALEGALMMAQPRMEGPQSDKDVALYKQMAGQIGDTTIPAGNKKAALDAIEKLHSKYAANVPQKAGAAKPAPKVWDVQDGYRFKGGDPADPQNWTKVK